MDQASGLLEFPGHLYICRVRKSVAPCPLGQPNVKSMFSEVFIDILRITKLGLFLGYIVYRIRYLLNMSVVDGCISTGKSGKRSWKSNPNALLENDSHLPICCNSTGVLSGSWHHPFMTESSTLKLS